ncbi:hypothetical protein FB45DRAFT_918803 [Roridomyces roridus]|uniref:Uncharacterized protein n=1 Tax=Roridomyces roridus TaxID=1738132 RepID=A0AAD7BRF5_9AGAR|nr:hypothetical protein FB45DRAFT_918803 [Roridomyces roridus]
MTALVLPPGIGFVAGGYLSTAFLLVFQFMTVGSYRKGSGVEYPRLYAEKAEMASNVNAVKFNCAQRAHANTLENIPIVWSLTGIVSLQYPTFAASLLTAWSFARVFYTLGYVTGDPKKRTNFASALHYPILLTLLGTATWTVAKLISLGI